jgi:hypothetical protein
MDNNADGSASPPYESGLVGHQDVEVICGDLAEIDKLPLPPSLADKPRDYFAQIVRLAADEANSRLPKGELPSPLLRSAMKAGLPPSAPERTNEGRIGIPSTSQSSPSPKIPS